MNNFQDSNDAANLQQGFDNDGDEEDQAPALAFPRPVQWHSKEWNGMKRGISLQYDSMIADSSSMIYIRYDDNYNYKVEVEVEVEVTITNKSSTNKSKTSTSKK